MTRAIATRVLLVAAMLASAVGAGSVVDERSIILATTTSTQDSGLLDDLVPRFEQATGIAVKVIAVGTGAALRMASTGDADAVLVHAPQAEQPYVQSGDLVEGRQIMHNDFVIVGPPDDPAGAGRQPDVGAVMRAIAERGVFISRGDDSGTHKQELALWSAAGVDPRAMRAREETGQGMGATLNVADQKHAYTLTDRGTYLALRQRLGLTIVFQGDARLANIYHAYVVNPQRHPRVNLAGARRFVEFLVSPETQRAIGEFKRHEFGQPLFFPDALADKRTSGG